MSENSLVCLRRSCSAGKDIWKRSGVSLGDEAITTSWLGLRTGSGLNRNWFTMLKMAVFAPIPRASVRTITAVNPGEFRSTRKP